MHSVFVCLIMVSTAIGAPQVNITASGGLTVVIAPDNFEFYCSSNVSANFTIEVDGLTEGDKFDRITSEIITDNETTYILEGTEPSDNGTTFMCVAVIGDANYTSQVLTLQVDYSPVFYQNNSDAVLYEMPSNETVKLHCDVMANPTDVKFYFTNDSSNSTGVSTKVKGSNATIIFDKAVVGNRGTYNCTASNSIGNSTLTYKVFVGGIPNGVNISCESTTSSDFFQYVCKVHNDGSDAPATALILESPGLGISKTVKFQESALPLSDATFTLLNTSVLEVVPNNYSLYLYAVNQLGNASILKDTAYFGHSINVSISTDNRTVYEKESFNFTCSSLEANATYMVYVDGSERQDRVMTTTSTNTSQSYSYNYTTYEDNGRTFQCLVNKTINGTAVLFKSPIIPIEVLYPPKYTLDDIVGTPLNNTKKAVILLGGYTANPDVVNVTWRHDGTVLKSNTLPNQLILNNVLVEDRGNYTVQACNVVGCGNGTLVVDVYYPPLFSHNTNGSQWIEIRTDSSYNITCTVVDSNPPVTHMNFTYKGSSDNVRIITDNTSITLEITKASHINAMNYTCEATSTIATSHQVFQTFVGGAPDKVEIKNISTTSDGGKDPIITISIDVTDGSSAPARNITYNIKGNSTNHTVPILAPIRTRPVSLDISSRKVSSYGADQVTILFWAANDLGTVYITEKTITFYSPTTPPKPNKPKSQSHAGAIVAGILVPLFVIILILVGVAAGWYFYKKRSGGGRYVRLNVQGKDIDDAGGYGAT